LLDSKRVCGLCEQGRGCLMVLRVASGSEGGAAGSRKVTGCDQNRPAALAFLLILKLLVTILSFFVSG